MMIVEASSQESSCLAKCKSLHVLLFAIDFEQGSAYISCDMIYVPHVHVETLLLETNM